MPRTNQQTEQSPIPEVDAVRRKLDDIPTAGLEKKGFVALGSGEGGFACLLSQSPLWTINDLRKHRLHTDNHSRLISAARPRPARRFLCIATPWAIMDNKHDSYTTPASQ